MLYNRALFSATLNHLLQIYYLKMWAFMYRRKGEKSTDFLYCLESLVLLLFIFLKKGDSSKREFLIIYHSSRLK